MDGRSAMAKRTKDTTSPSLDLCLSSCEEYKNIVSCSRDCKVGPEALKRKNRAQAQGHNSLLPCSRDKLPAVQLQQTKLPPKQMKNYIVSSNYINQKGGTQQLSKMIDAAKMKRGVIYQKEADNGMRNESLLPLILIPSLKPSSLQPQG